LRVGAKARDEQRQHDQDRINHLARDLEQANVQTIDLQRSVSRTGNLEAEHERLARVVSDRENEILRLKEELDRLDAKIHAQSRDMLAYQEDLDEMVDKLRRVQAERNEIDANLTETMAIIEDRNEDLRTSRDQLDEVGWTISTSSGVMLIERPPTLVYRPLIN
jgi:chromosome segregation ATPase